MGWMASCCVIRECKDMKELQWLYWGRPTVWQQSFCQTYNSNWWDFLTQICRDLQCPHELHGKFTGAGQGQATVLAKQQKVLFPAQCLNSGLLDQFMVKSNRKTGAMQKGLPQYCWNHRVAEHRDRPLSPPCRCKSSNKHLYQTNLLHRLLFLCWEYLPLPHTRGFHIIISVTKPQLLRSKQ